MIDKIFSSEKPDLVDIEFKSHGLKDYIKTGFRCVCVCVCVCERACVRACVRSSVGKQPVDAISCSYIYYICSYC